MIRNNKNHSDYFPINSDIIRRYNQLRQSRNVDFFCYAPFKNIYFNIHGDAAPCWQSFINPDSYPQKSIKEIWKGHSFNEIREGIRSIKLSAKCETCRQNLLKGNFLSVLARAYDNDYVLSEYPSIMELELGNTCNLECIMCNGHLSSSIAKNREKKEPLISPYDNTFVEQLEEFLPHLKEVRFNGGESFLNEINFTILERLIAVNPQVNIVMATNGTVINDRIKSLMQRGQFNINISIDSLNKDNYEKIRINARFDKVMDNFMYFYKYCRKQKTSLCVLTNPMPQNWQEMPDFIWFCNSYNIPIWFNTIITPKSCALSALPSEELKHIHGELSRFRFKTNPFKKHSRHNAKVFHNLVHQQIKSWINEAIEREKTTNASGPTGNSKQTNEHIFVDTLLHYLNEKNNDEGKATVQYELLKDKILKLFELMPLDFDKEDFYSKLIDVPVNLVAGELEYRTPQELKKLTETKL